MLLNTKDYISLTFPALLKQTLKRNKMPVNGTCNKSWNEWLQKQIQCGTELVLTTLENKQTKRQSLSSQQKSVYEILAQMQDKYSIRQVVIYLIQTLTFRIFCSR